MKRLSFLLLLLLGALSVGGQQVLSVRSRLAMDWANSMQRAPGQDGRSVQAFVQVDDVAAVQRLEQAGAVVNTVTGDIATVLMPLACVDDIAHVGGVKSIAFAQRLSLTNDSARILSCVEPIHNGSVGKQPYTGKGVIVGMIDTGVDFNHINLCDVLGRSRVIAAYMPADFSGTSPVIDGRALPGSHYDSPAAIAALTTDNVEQSHGTHTTGTAAGSYRDNGMHGVAPDAHIVVCAMPDSALTDVNIANSVKYIFDVAQRNNMPCVINMSLGSDDGPHDGSSMLCRLFDEVSGPGRICVVSAANSAARAHVIDYWFKNDNDTIFSCIAPYSTPRDGVFSSYISAWSRSAQPHTVVFTAVSRSTGNVLCSWQVPLLSSTTDVASFDLAADSVFANYFSVGSIRAACGIEPCNGNFHTVAEFAVKPVSSDIYLGVKFVAPRSQRISVWGGSGVVFTRFNHSYMRAGSREMSINDMATGDRAISVGAYCSRRFMPLAQGGQLENKRSVVGDIAYFSGFGPDVRGIARPDVTAPGFSLVSSSSRYDSTSGLATTWQAPGVNVDGQFYSYASQYGTSMSTPVVAGAIALWLEIDSTLSPERIRSLLQRSSTHDDFTAVNPSQWGAGKLDVTAATQLLLQESVVTGISTQRLRIVGNPSNGSFKILGLDSRALISVVDLQGRVVAQTVVEDEGNVQLGDYLVAGYYIMNIYSRHERFSAPVIIKR